MDKRNTFFSVPAAIILALGLVGGCLVLGKAAVDFKGKDRYVTVKGLAEKEVAADLAMWPISYSAGGDTLMALDAALNVSHDKVLAFLAEQGLGDAEIIDTAPRITDNQMNRPGQRVAQRYTAHAVLSVRTKSIAKVKQAMARAGVLVSRGVLLAQNWEYRPTFAFTGLNSIKPEMIAEATRNARNAAKQFAADSGSKVGNIRRANQGYFSLQDRDQYTPEIKKVRVVTTIQYFLED